MKPVSKLMLSIVIPLCAFCACNQNPENRFAKARSEIEKLMEAKGIASFQVAVAKDGKMIYEEAFGWANVKKRIPATNETMYLVASIEKPFISTALMIMAERGKIDLGAPINNYLGKNKLIANRGSAADATVTRLLLHVSGMAYGYYISSESFPREKRRSNSDLMELAGVLVYPPGTVYEYTNYGYGLLDEIVERAAGGDLKEFVTKEVISPLGLAHTTYFKSQPPEELIATQNINDGTLPVFLGLYSTAGDLARFGMFHLKARLPSQETILADSSIDLLREYMEPGVKYTTRTIAWDVQQDYGYQAVMHGGGGPGIHNYLYMIPSENLVIAYMSNAQYSSSSSVLVELIAAAVPGFTFVNRMKGRGWPQAPELDPRVWQGEWTGRIAGPKGSCPVAVSFNSQGIPKLRIGDGGAGEWVSPNKPVQHGGGKVCYRFDAHIPYLHSSAWHDEIVLIMKPEGSMLVGSASAAKEKNFGIDENYVLPQYIELSQTSRR
jgi:CubicO group peptidase (beta-lactamase class C family)